LLCVADATVVAKLKELQVSINDFDVKGIIGRGHFGEIQVARERSTNNVYALKILPKADVLSQQNVSCMFEKHQNVIISQCNIVSYIICKKFTFWPLMNRYLCKDFLLVFYLCVQLWEHQNSNCY